MADILSPYQKDAVKKMSNGCILCGGVGTGKSRTSLGYYYTRNKGDIDNPKYPKMKKPKNLFIITTARKRDTFEWDAELSLYGLSQHKDSNTYSNTVVVDSWNMITKYSKVSDSFFIFDEQRVVGSGVWVKSFLEIAKHNEWILLSATPGDRWTDYIPVFVANGFYKNRSEFIKEHVIYKRFAKFPQVDRYVNTKRLVRLRDRILVTMDYAIPVKIFHRTIFTEYDRPLYKHVMTSRWNIYDDKPIQNAGELCRVLREIVNSDNSKINCVLDIVKAQKKVIIFYNYDYELNILKHIDYGPDVSVAEWNGHVHNAIPYTESWVYLVQYNAGAEGWNCIMTNTIIFYSENYSYRIMEQSAGRIARMNTPYTELIYYHLKTKSPIDISISRAIDQKKKFSESAFERKFKKMEIL